MTEDDPIVGSALMRAIFGVLGIAAVAVGIMNISVMFSRASHATMINLFFAVLVGIVLMGLTATYCFYRTLGCPGRSRLRQPRQQRKDLRQP